MWIEKEYKVNSLERKVEEPTMFVYNQNEKMLLVLYVNRKAWKKIVLVLTKMHDTVTVSKGERSTSNVNVFMIK